MIANGLGPVRLARSVRKGAQLDALRGGRLDKRGVGARILDATGRIDENELVRLDHFAADKVDSSGMVERGLGIDQLRTMMDANFARAVGQRRRIDESLDARRVADPPSSDGQDFGPWPLPVWKKQRARRPPIRETRR